jgi:hypothetical protein
MWVKDHYGRLVNLDNVMYLECYDKNWSNVSQTKLWTIGAHIKARDAKRYIDKSGKSVAAGVTMCLTEGFPDKEEANLRMEQIAEGIANGADIVALD